MIWQNWDPFKKNKREALIKKMVLKRLGDEIRLSLCLVEESICHETRNGHYTYGSAADPSPPPWV